MISEGVDAFGRRAIVTAAPYIMVDGEPHHVDAPGIETGAEVAVVGEEGQNLRVSARADGRGRAVLLHRDCLTLVPLQPVPPAPITPEVAAHVLWHYRQIGYPPGSFTSALIRTIAGADVGNRRLLARGFPDYVRAVEMATETVGGIDTLRRVLETRKPG